MTLRHGLVVAVVLGLASASASASFILQSDNSQVRCDPASPAGVSSWIVDGRELLTRQWFFFRVGSTGPEQDLSTLAAGTPGLFDMNGDGLFDAARLTYSGQGLWVDVTLVLQGASAGSGMSDLAEIIRITNTSRTESIGLHFFQYVDFDLSDGVDTLVIEGGNTARQKGPTAWVAETVVTPAPSLYQAGTADVLYGLLTDAAPTTLNNTAGPLTGNTAWAFEWDVTLGPGKTLLISKDKNIVPEPATLALLGGGAVLAFLIRRKR